ncbi:von willebrand factor type egf and pentraxin domain-containing protein 1 [Lasius niger]|uniref:von willebrand factor type egf and pentraxin domain-containing protein 1 n=1 Tax=Lasius niger TaxID=67767 RepID=A0A0J7L8C2_LASNI|nr:von willebrand factor type egf and pentraxin domain-containing protein 1 [Lasius niger]
MGAVRDQKDRTLWRWTGSGEEVSVSFWSIPQGTEDDCARYDGSRGWLWSDTPCTARLNFICQHQPQACGRPEQPPNSTMTVTTTSTRTPGSVYEVGASVEYSCNVGSLLIGPATRTCLDTGFYNEFPPVCKSIECGYPASIKHGGYTLINNTVNYLSQVLYSCEEGYEMTVGSIVTYTCEKGYRLVGFRQILCLATGLYDHVAPTCIEESRTTVSTPTRATIRPSTPKVRPYLTPRIRTTTSAATVTTSTTSLPARKVPNTAELPATVRETISKRPSVGLNKPALPSSVLNDAGSDHPQDNEISGSGVDHAQAGIGAAVPEPSGPFRVDEQPSGAHQAKLNLGAVIALGVFGGFVFLAAVITTVVILIRRNRGRSSKHYRHRASPDCNTVASFDSSSSESRGGLNRYYRQAWENLHETAGHKTSHPPLRRKETLDEPGYRENFRGNSNNTERDGSELVVSDVAAYPSSKHASISDKKRHHHHHHHHHGNATPDWRQSQSHHRY